MVATGQFLPTGCQLPDTGVRHTLSCVHRSRMAEVRGAKNIYAGKNSFRLSGGGGKTGGGAANIPLGTEHGKYTDVATVYDCGCDNEP